MVAVVKAFNYTGTVQDATIPAGTTSIDIYLWGGAGGGGGSDRHSGGSGAAGHFVKKTSYSVTSNVGDTVQVAVGGSGGGGAGQAPAAGGDAAAPTTSPSTQSPTDPGGKSYQTDGGDGYPGSYPFISGSGGGAGGALSLIHI